MAVGVSVGVPVAVPVAVAVEVTPGAVAVAVSVGAIGVTVAVVVTVGVGVPLGVKVAVGVRVLVGVLVGVRVGGMNWVGVEGNVTVGGPGVKVISARVGVALDTGAVVEGKLVIVVMGTFVGWPLPSPGAIANATNPAQ